MMGTSEVHNKFLQPLREVYSHAKRTRHCPVHSDLGWLEKGCERVLCNVRSGRDFLQRLAAMWSEPIATGVYFDTLASSRRLAMVEECSRSLRQQVDECRVSALAQFAALDEFEIFAGDGHYLEAATHDRLVEETHWPTGHFFSLNLKTQSLFPLTLADLDGRKKEHDNRALKRQSVAMLRQGAGVGRKVMWVWDKAGVDLPFWQERKASGIYFLSMQKEGMCLELEKERLIDSTQPINQGVLSDRIVRDRRDIRIRQITFENPCDAKVYVYLTTEMTLEPGLLVLLYKTRWEIEKVFDETKTKLQEQKSWATTINAKQMQSHFVSIVHNLLLLLQDRLQERGIENIAELARKQKRLEQQQLTLQKKRQTLPLVYTALQRFTQAPFKLIRWLRAYWYSQTPLLHALLHLKRLYAHL